MKSKLFEDFDERAKEVSKYFFLLKNLEQGSIKLSMGNDNNIKVKKIDTELDKTLKATGFLLLYNLIESTVRNAIEAIFDDMENKATTFDDLSEKLQKIVIQNLKKNKSPDNVLAAINNISLDIISASFDKQQLFSGNINAKDVKKIAKAYGFSYKTNAIKTQDGKDLEKIRTNRNDLSHGVRPFKEVGKNATADELLEIKKRVICYLREILENIDITY